MIAPYNCNHCGKYFDQANEKIFVIWSVILKAGEDGQLHWTWGPKEGSTNLYFHQKCFEEVAGKQYMQNG